MTMPFYISYSDFSEHYQKDFERWKTEIPEGREIDFLKELLGVYNKYNDIFFDKLNEHEFTLLIGETDFGDLDANTIKILFHIHDNYYTNDDLYFRISQIDQSKLKNIQYSIRKIIEWADKKIKETQGDYLGGGKKKSFSFINNFNNVEKDTVYNYFNSALVSEGMITENDLQTFLIAAFQEMQPTTNKITIKSGFTKNNIMKVFYNFYVEIAGKPYGKQRNYAGLLGDYFNNYDTNNVSSNFSKTTY